jgi:DNA-binding NarL/FixJ family response regulator
MAQPLLYDIVESPAHPDLAALSQDLGLERLVFSAQRKAIGSLKRRPPDIVVADFFFGYGNNYAGANVSNLDVLLRSLQRFAPAARVVVLADRHEIGHVDKLAALFDLHAVVAVPAARGTLASALG